MENRSGRDRRLLAPLLILLLFGASAAAPFSAEKAYRAAREAADRGDLVAASAKADAALERAGNAQTEWTWALRILKLEIQTRGAARHAAMAELERPLPSRFRTSEAAVRRLMGLGQARGDDKTKRALFEEAHKLAAAHQPHLLFSVHLALANVSEHAEADRHLKAALELARRRGDQLQIGLATSTLSKLLSDAERYADAVAPGHEALEILTRIRANGRAATTAGNLGWAYIELGETDAAHELFVRAETEAARSGNAPGRTIWMNQLGNVEFDRRKYAEAERWYSQALPLARASRHQQTAAILTNLARTNLELGRYAEAKRLAADALKANLDDDDQRLRSRIVDARASMMLGQTAEAESTLRDVRLKAKEKATRWWARGYLAQLYARTNRNELAEKAFLDAIKTVHEARDSISKPELRLAFFNVSADVFHSYVDFLVENERFEDALRATELIRAQSLEEQLGVPVTKKLDARAIAKQQRATILSYWLGRERSHLWIVTPGAVTYAALPPEKTITDEVDAYRADLAHAYRGTIENSGQRGARLWSMLVAPAKLAKGARVIVIADGALHTLSFEALVAAHPVPHYWIEDAIVSYAGSLQLLARSHANDAGAATMLLVGDAPEADPQFPKLRFAGEEIKSVARHFNQRVVLAGADATPAAYRKAAPERFAFVHFVAHGVAARKRPLDSAVILGRDQSQNYRLVARDIAAQPLHARLVTISSCQGAGQRTFAGEGLVGLAWAFLHAGAGEVIAALWPVDDIATPDFMNRMYAGIKAGHDPAVALREAKLTLVRSDGRDRKPHYWAPFVLYSGG